MAIINYTDQVKYTGKGYLDAKMMPVNSVDDLKKISLTQRFEGLTITVLNNGSPMDYWLVGGITNSCWIPKTTGGDYSKLKIVLDEGFLKLMNGDEMLGEAVDLNSYFPSQPETTNDLFIESVDYTTTNDNNEQGVFMCFTYSDGTKKYLNMSQFLSKTYEAGSGIVINGNVISLDDAINGRISEIENSISNINNEIIRISNELSTEKTDRQTAINDINSRLQLVIEKANANLEKINKNAADIENNKIEISALKERVNALSSAAEGSTPDGVTIGITDDEKKALYVKILEKEGNLIKSENYNGESGLFASIPVFYEDEELN